MTTTDDKFTRARAILADVRQAATPGPWKYLDHESWGGSSAISDAEGHPLAFDLGDGEGSLADAALIVLATDPDLLDAMDGMLADASNRPPEVTSSSFYGGYLRAQREYAERVADAIIAAHERTQ